MSSSTSRLKLRIGIEKFPLKEPFRITGYTMVDTEVLFVELEQEGLVGRGEASGVYYRPGDDVKAGADRLESLRGEIEAGIGRLGLQSLLPACAARNALDCALWDLDAKRIGRPAWRIAGLEQPKPLITTFTIGAGSAEKVAADARAYRQARAIKLKLTGEAVDAERVRAVRRERPDVWLGIDANQGFTRATLEKILPVLLESGVQLIEQPCKVGEESMLDGLDSPIPFAADESAQTLADVPGLVGRFKVVNIKLDKSGGLTEALAMAREAARLGLKVMVGNMLGTSLAMAPAFLVGQLCQVVDLDGPIFLSRDRAVPVVYSAGTIQCPAELWGDPSSKW
ncbi:MAG TPA: dipeptide epimerase [Steroidobacteraceae bacterium]|jgi:L-alanine-DL-glutamate epimerase-like enolase superfamily enzyme